MEFNNQLNRFMNLWGSLMQLTLGRESKKRERKGDDSKEDREIRKEEELVKKDRKLLNQLNRFMNLWGPYMLAVGRESKKKEREGDDSGEEVEKKDMDI